jgi:hypothetical protein
MLAAQSDGCDIGSSMLTQARNTDDEASAAATHIFVPAMSTQTRNTGNEATASAAATDTSAAATDTSEPVSECRRGCKRQRTSCWFAAARLTLVPAIFSGVQLCYRAPDMHVALPITLYLLHNSGCCEHLLHCRKVRASA